MHKNKLHIYLTLSAIFLTNIATPAHATDWAIIDGDGVNTNLVEMDMSSIQQLATIAKAWVRVSHAKPVLIVKGSKDKYSSALYRMIMDCSNNRYVFSTSILYSQIKSRGEILGTTKINEREAIYQMKEVAPDSIASAILHYACSYK